MNKRIKKKIQKKNDKELDEFLKAIDEFHKCLQIIPDGIAAYHNYMIGVIKEISSYNGLVIKEGNGDIKNEQTDQKEEK